MPNHSDARSGLPFSAILIFVRAPELGRVKTRLAAGIGDRAALRVYGRLATHAVGEALSLSPSAAVRVHFTPPDQREVVARWLGAGPIYLPQPPGDLGERLTRAFDQAFSDGYRKVLVIGSDLPGLSRERLEDALDLLDHSDAVIGPSRDGGYWLLGLRERRPELFADVEWSTERVLRQTLSKLRAGGIDPILLEELTDVDEADDLPAGWEAWATDADGDAPQR